MKRKDNDTLVIKSHDINLDGEYAAWIADVKHRYRSAQVKASVKVNAEKLIFNWLLGRDLVQKKAEERWGSGVVEQVSLDLKHEFPNADGLSARNLWYMKRWYIFYTQDNARISQQVITKLQRIETQFLPKLHQAGAVLDEEGNYPSAQDFPLPFALIPWRHHVEIITKCTSIDEALFYVGKTIEQGLSRDALVNCIKAKLYAHQGKIANNFTNLLPAMQSELVQEVLKENYDFGFATVEHAIYNEAELEQALTQNVTNLLLEMGTGFAFVGRQKELIIGGRSRKIDLIFYHIHLRCYIVCELKARSFEPEFTGKLNYYVNAVDELLKTNNDNPTIGLLICSDMNRTDVQWSFKGIATPLSVATYNNIRIKDMLPSKEQMQERLETLQKEIHKTKMLMNKNNK